MKKAFQLLVSPLLTDLTAIFSFFRHFSFSKVSLSEPALVLFLILSSYAYSFSNLATYFALFAIVFDLIHKKPKSIQCFLPYLLFGIYLSLCSFLFCLSSSDKILALKYSANFLLITFLCVSLSSSCSLKRILIIFKIVGLVVAFGLFYQAIMVYVLHQRVAPIRILPLPTNAYYRNRFLSTQDRPMSFFLEPSQYASFATVVFAIALVQFDVLLAIPVGVSILLSGSTAGIFYVAILVAFFWFYLFKKLKKNPMGSIWFWIGFIVLFSAAMVVFYKTNTIEKLFSKYSSTSNRLFSGYEVFAQMPLFMKLFGCQYPNIATLLDSGVLDVPFSQYLTYGFSNSVGILLIQFGFVGFFVGLIEYLLLSKISFLRLEAVPFWIIITLSLLIESSLFSSVSLFEHAILFIFIKQGGENSTHQPFFQISLVHLWKWWDEIRIKFAKRGDN